MPINKTAFPTIATRNYGNAKEIVTTDSGMTLRDWFAGQSNLTLDNATGILRAQKVPCDSLEQAFEKLAELKYMEADAMLKQREKQEK